MKINLPDALVTLSTLWIFATLNYLYCDVLGLMDSGLLRDFLDGRAGDLHITEGFLLGSGVLMEIPIAMVLLSRVLPRAANRRANVVAGSIMAAVQVASLFVGTPTSYYLFFSVIEVAAVLLVVRLAWGWRGVEAAPVGAGAVTAA